MNDAIKAQNGNKAKARILFISSKLIFYNYLFFVLIILLHLTLN